MPQVDVIRTRTEDTKAETISLRHKSTAISLVSGASEIRSNVNKWINLFRNFYKSRVENCKAQAKEPKVVEEKLFPTGATYKGDWDALDMKGHGVYTFANRVVYEGGFENGWFHGLGELRYTDGMILRGKWDQGKLVEKKMFYPDGLEHLDVDHWLYCKYPDRRYAIEYDEGIPGAGESYRTNDQPTPKVPPGWYDIGYGWFDPETCYVFKYNDISSIMSITSKEEKNWIVANCRTAPERPIGQCNFLYEEWVKPLLEFENPPPPAALTKMYIANLEPVETQNENDEDRIWRKMRFSRSSHTSRSSSGGSWKRSVFKFQT